MQHYLFHRMLARFPPCIFGSLALINGIVCQLLEKQISMFFIGTAISELLSRTHHWNRITAWLTIILISCGGALRFASQQARYFNEISTIPYGLCTIQGTLLDTGLTKNKAFPFYLHIRTHTITSAHDPKKIIASPLVIRVTLRPEIPIQPYTKGTVLELSNIALMKP